MAHDEIEAERALVKWFTQCICLLALAADSRDATQEHVRVAWHYGAEIDRQHAEGVPLAAMVIGERALARATRRHRATNKKRLAALLAKLPPPLRDRAPRLGE